MHKDAQSPDALAMDALGRTVPRCMGRMKTHYDREQIQRCHDRMDLIRHNQNQFLTNFEGAEHNIDIIFP